jgi:hypothetical protein
MLLIIIQSRGHQIMDDRFRPIYSDLYESYARSHRDVPSQLERELQFRDGLFSRYFDNASSVIFRAIEESQKELEQNGLPILREDAKFFLMICFTQMVYTPLLLAVDVQQLQTLVNENPRLDFLVSQDIRTIARNAAQSTEAPDQLISTHALVDSLPSVWGKLRTGATRLWEGDS